MGAHSVRPIRPHLAALAALLVTALALVASGPPAALAAGWEIQLQGEDTWINQVVAVSTTEAWAIRDDYPKLMRTTDGGASWYDADNTGLTDDYEAFDFYDSLHGCVGNRVGKVACTSDGGANWGIVQTTCQAQEISFASATVAWMGGMNPRGKILYTDDGGATWEEQVFDATLQRDVRAVAAVSPTTCWAANWDGIMRTTDAGANWPATAFVVPEDAYIGCMTATDADHAWVGGGGTGFRYIMATDDGGATWTTQYSGASGSSYFEAIDVLPDNLHGWAVSGDGVVFFTTDGGATWLPQPSGVSTILLDVDFVDADNGWATGTSGVILHTGDGGGEADAAPPVTTPSRVSGAWVNAANANLYLTATDAGVGAWRIYHKVDGAADWSWGWPSGVNVMIPVLPNGPHLVQFYALDKGVNAETVQDFTLNVDSRAPSPGGVAAATVVSGGVASLRYKIVDRPPNGGRGKARIRVMTAAGKVLKVIRAKNQRVNRPLVAKFTCTLPPGTYKYVVDVTDQVGNHRAKVATAPLVVK